MPPQQKQEEPQRIMDGVVFDEQQTFTPVHVLRYQREPGGLTKWLIKRKIASNQSTAIMISFVIAIIAFALTLVIGLTSRTTIPPQNANATLGQPMPPPQR